MDTTPEKTDQEVWDELDTTVETPKEEPKEEPAAKADAAPVAAQPEPAADDPFKELPEAVKNTIVGLQTQVGAMATRLRNSEGRLGELNGTIKQWQTAKPAAPTAAEVHAAQASPAKLDQLKADYPELFDGFEQLLAQRLPAQQSIPPGLVTQAELQAALEKQAKDSEVESAHKGWKRTVQSPEFAGWYSQQPAEIRALADSDEPAVAIRMLDLFAGTKAKRAPNPTIAAAAAIPTGRPGTSAKGKPLDEMTPEEQWAYYDAKDRAAARR